MKKLIFSTKGFYGKGACIFYIILSFLFCPIFAIDSVITKIITLVYIALMCIPIGKNYGLYKSYIDLYEDHIEGTTTPNKVFGAKQSMKTFNLNYNEITHLSYKKNIVIISFGSGTYEVQAKSSEQKVINIIKQQSGCN